MTMQYLVPQPGSIFDKHPLCTCTFNEDKWCTVFGLTNVQPFELQHSHFLWNFSNESIITAGAGVASFLSFPRSERFKSFLHCKKKGCLFGS